LIGKKLAWLKNKFKMNFFLKMEGDKILDQPKLIPINLLNS